MFKLSASIFISVLLFTSAGFASKNDPHGNDMFDKNGNSYELSATSIYASSTAVTMVNLWAGISSSSLAMCHAQTLSYYLHLPIRDLTSRRYFSDFFDCLSMELQMLETSFSTTGHLTKGAFEGSSKKEDEEKSKEKLLVSIKTEAQLELAAVVTGNTDERPLAHTMISMHKEITSQPELSRADAAKEILSQQ